VAYHQWHGVEYEMAKMKIIENNENNGNGKRRKWRLSMKSNNGENIEISEVMKWHRK
jgi:hypothetical protein